LKKAGHGAISDLYHDGLLSLVWPATPLAKVSTSKSRLLHHTRST
jgi:hypothetical protein